MAIPHEVNHGQLRLDRSRQARLRTLRAANTSPYEPRPKRRMTVNESRLTGRGSVALNCAASRGAFPVERLERARGTCDPSKAKARPEQGQGAPEPRDGRKWTSGTHRAYRQARRASCARPLGPVQVRRQADSKAKAAGRRGNAAISVGRTLVTRAGRTAATGTVSSPLPPMASTAVEVSTASSVPHALKACASLFDTSEWPTSSMSEESGWSRRSADEARPHRRASRNAGSAREKA